MSTDAYLSKLSLDQLEYARNKADELIAEKKREKKFVVWALEDDDMRLAFFHEPDYLKAVDALAKEAKERAATFKTGRAEHLRLAITPLYSLESEYAEFGIGPPPSISAD